MRERSGLCEVPHHGYGLTAEHVPHLLPRDVPRAEIRPIVSASRNSDSEVGRHRVRIGLGACAASFEAVPYRNTGSFGVAKNQVAGLENQVAESRQREQLAIGKQVLELS